MLGAGAFGPFLRAGCAGAAWVLSEVTSRGLEIRDLEILGTGSWT